MMRNDQLSTLQELVGYSHAFAQQPARVLPQVKNQAFDIAHLFERLRDFMLGGFLESGNVHVADTRLDHEMEVYAIAWNFIADHRKFKRMVGAFPQHGDTDGGSFRSLQQVSYVRGAHVV